jgi:hypothetical protein
MRFMMLLKADRTTDAVFCPAREDLEVMRNYGMDAASKAGRTGQEK